MNYFEFDTTAFLTIFNIFVSIGVFIFSIISNQKIENVKSKLDVQNSKKKIFIEAEINAIESFFTNFKLWYDDNRSLSEYDTEQMSRIKKLSTILSESYQKVYNDLSKIELYINNKELMDSTVRLILLTKKMQDINIDYSPYLYELLCEKFAILNSNVSNEVDAAASMDNDIYAHLLKYNAEFILMQKSILNEKDIFLKLAKEYLNRD